ncbi:SdpI family protein [Flavobacterium psychrotrophum]|uniref:SdpI family protein n=1 Tax=Flavobacterium psychrotrophum TaxID=2294119 RepID=UPI000E32303E|nr:SdpI family protein [Flavobacterium psychrotrophum]
MELYLGNTGLLCGLVFFIMGGIMYKWPPKNINGLYGYRTGSSMQSQERWEFAQRFSAIQMIKAGGALMLVSLILALLQVGIEVITTIGTVLLLACTGYLLFSTERAIKKNFGNK